MKDRAGAEEPDAGNDLGRDARRVTVRPAIRCESDLGDADREMREEGRADADENIRTEARRFPRHLALEADRAAEQGGEEQLDEQHELEGVAHRTERPDLEWRTQEVQGEQRDYRPPRPALGRTKGVVSARVEVAQVTRRRVRRRVPVRDASGLILELRNRRFVRLGWRGEIPEDRAATALTGHRGRNRLIVELLIATRQADEGEKTARTGLIGHGRAEGRGWKGC